MFKALKVSVAILNLIRASMGSQWSLYKVNELETVKPVPVTLYKQEMGASFHHLTEHSIKLRSVRVVHQLVPIIFETINPKYIN